MHKTCILCKRPGPKPDKLDYLCSNGRCSNIKPPPDGREPMIKAISTYECECGYDCCYPSYCTNCGAHCFPSHYKYLEEQQGNHNNNDY